MRQTQSSAGFTLGRAVRKLFVSAFVIFTFFIYTVHERLAGPTPTASANALPTAKAAAVAGAPKPTAAPAAKTTDATGAGGPNPTAAPANQPAAAAAEPTQTVYIVQPGDTLDIIALHYGVTVEAIMAANGIANPNMVSAGQSLVIPASTTAPINQDTNATLQPPAQPTAAPANPTAAGQYKDGQYTGTRVDAFYGWVQVQAVIQNGQIADVKFLEYPSDRRTSQRINSIATPWLTQEAIQAQSANVDIISGATLTSEAFAQSLQAALQTATP
jgi:uncharacterized protein with FMN-binding domain